MSEVLIWAVVLVLATNPLALVLLAAPGAVWEFLKAARKVP
jgi:hypothetical protein